MGWVWIDILQGNWVFGSVRMKDGKPFNFFSLVWYCRPSYLFINHFRCEDCYLGTKKITLYPKHLRRRYRIEVILNPLWRALEKGRFVTCHAAFKVTDVSVIQQRGCMSHVKIVFRQRLEEFCIAPWKVSKIGPFIFESLAVIFCKL